VANFNRIHVTEDCTKTFHNSVHGIGEATRRVVLENRKLVTKGEDLRLQGSTTSKTGAHKSKKGAENRAHRGSHYDLMNDRNPW